MKIKKTLLILTSILLSVSLFACSSPYLPIVEEYSETGINVFNMNKSSNEATVIFFDDDNIVNEDGTSFTRPKRHVSKTIGSSDCYMVKSGTVELLVDGGYQSMTSYGSVNSNYEYNDEYVKNECQENILKKIASVISSDGVLDYLIVTHADYDHIAALIAKGGIFDAFLNKKTITTLDGSTVTFNRINYILDFDSGLVKNFSDEDLDKKNRLVRSDYYQAYVQQRELLVEMGTSYCPASALFDNGNLESQNYSFSEDDRNEGMPDSIIDRLKDVPSNSDVQYILDENYNNGVNTIKDVDYKDEKILQAEVGCLKEIKNKDDVSKYYYSFKFNGGELRILYNWHYDYIYHSSFNRDTSDSDSTQSTDPSDNVYDSQDANNISVCFEVVKDNFKFLSLGDLGGAGENGLLKYYKDTNILSNVSVFKASHHGSVNNGENSEELFSTTKPSLIVVTGCACYKNPQWKKSEDDPVISAMVGRTKTNQALFDNISKAYAGKKNQPMIMYTNINSYRNVSGVPYFESVPFYGDIKVKYSGGKLHVSTSYCGQIDAYISQKWNAEYYHKNNKEFSFVTRKDNRILSIQGTDWFKEIGFTYGGN